MTIRSYTELITLSTFEERFDYLKLHGTVGRSTFGAERHLNQTFYTSREWSHIRNFCIARDYGNDLALDGHGIRDRLIIHHMNPITIEDISLRNRDIVDPEFLITTGHHTHNAIHYGASAPKTHELVVRSAGDTTLWNRKDYD